MLTSKTTIISDNAIVLSLGRRLMQLRLADNLTQAQLATKAGVSKRTVERLEAGSATQLHNFVRICRALGVVENFAALVPEPTISPMDLLRLKGEQRQRASRPKKLRPGDPYPSREPSPTWEVAMERAKYVVRPAAKRNS